MRAIILATGTPADGPPSSEYVPQSLFPLLDKPFIQHVIEFLIRQGVGAFDFILHQRPDRMEALLGDGKRWGVRFTHHLARDAAKPYAPIRILGLSAEDPEPVVIGHANRLPQISLGAGSGPPVAVPILYYFRDDSSSEVRSRLWTGWALVPAHVLAALPPHLNDAGLEAYLRAAAGEPACQVEVSQYLAVNSLGSILAAHQLVLRKEFDNLFAPVRETSAGVWRAQQTNLAASVEIIPPVYIGEHCRIGAGVRLGPYAVVNRECVLDDCCRVAHAVIASGTYVGEAVELTDAVVERDILTTAASGGPVVVQDPLLLGNLYRGDLGEWAGRLVARGSAAILLAAALPILFGTALFLKLFRRGRLLYRRDVVRLPAEPEVADWECFPVWSLRASEAPPRCSFRSVLLEILPGLVNVARGELAFCGLPPRTAEEVMSLPQYWQACYFTTRAGLITEASVNQGPEPGDEELYALDAYYAAHRNLTYDVKLVTRYLRRLLRGVFQG